MKLVPMSFAAAILIILSCSSVESAPQDSLQDKLTKLEVQMTQKLDKAHAVYSQLTDDYLRLERRVAALESENQLLRIDVKKLNEKLDQTGGGGPAREGPTPGVDRTEVAIKIDQALSKLKASGNVDDAAKELLPVARYAVPKMASELKPGNPDYVASLEKVLAKCPVTELKGPLEDSVKDRTRRTSVARVVGLVGDRELSKILEPHIGDPDPIVQIGLGEALLACKNRMGVPPLLKALSAPESEIRFLAIRSLKRLNQNKTFDFDMNKNADENAAAIKSWHDWWAKEGPKLFE